MPFVIGDEEQKKKDQGEQQNISGSSTSFNVNVPGQTEKPGGPKSSGQYQNIQKYLQANQPQGEAMGQKVASNVEQTAEQAKTLGGQLQSSIKGPEAYDPSKVLSNLPSATEEEKKTYQTTKASGGYTGPSDITEASGYGEFEKQKARAGEQLAQSKTDVGQQELLKQTYARPSYTRGATALDQTLLQQSTGGRAAIEGLGSKYSDLLSTLGGYETGTQEAINQAKTIAGQNIAAFDPAEKAAQASIIDPLTKRAQEANVRDVENYNAYLADLADLNLKQSTLDALGLGVGTSTYGLDLGSYVSPQVGQASIQNIATQDELNKYNQLMDFLNQNSGLLPRQLDAYKGTSVDKERLAADLAAKQAEFENFARNKSYLANLGTVSAGDLFSDIENAAQQGNLGNQGAVTQTTSSLYDILNSGMTPEQYVNTLGLQGYSLQNRDDIINQINADLNQYNYNKKIGLEA